MSIHNPSRNTQSIRVASHLRVRLPATPPPLLRPNGGGQPCPCACAQGPTNTLKKLHASCMSSQPLLLHTNGHVNNSVHASTCCNCGISTVFSQTAPEETAGPAHRDVEHHIHALQLGITVVCRITWTNGNSLCVTTRMSTTCRCTQRACERPCPRTFSQCAETVGSRL